VVVVVVVLAGCSDAQELRIIPRTGSAKVKINFFIIWNSYHDIKAISPHLMAAMGCRSHSQKLRIFY
jgi:hypothetical protein